MKQSVPMHRDTQGGGDVAAPVIVAVDAVGVRALDAIQEVRAHQIPAAVRAAVRFSVQLVRVTVFNSSASVCCTACDVRGHDMPFEVSRNQTAKPMTVSQASVMAITPRRFT